MRKTVYLCDHCNKEIGDKNHITINLQSDSGIALASKETDMQWNWGITSRIKGIKQFCNAKCIGTYFSKILKEVNNRK